MTGSGPNWEGILKWSLAQSDGTRPTRNLSEEDRKWFMEAMQAQTTDVIKRMKEITLVMQTPKEVLDAQGVSSTDLLGLLDELQEHVESIDMANDLHSIGGLVPLLGFVKNNHPGIRAKAADVVTTIVQNNSQSQKLVMEANGLEPLLDNFISDGDMNVRTQSLGAISSLIRYNKPGIVAFRLGNGYAGLKDALSSDNIRFQRKALNLIQYLLQESSSDCSIVSELGFPRIMMHLVSSNDAGVREAALRSLLEFSRDQSSGANILAEEDGKLKQILEDRINNISLMSQEDLGAAKEERQLVDSLWNACFNEPSALHDKGLVSLPEDDAPPPDVASKLFEPRLRAMASNPAASPISRSEKRETPLLLAPGTSSAPPNSQENPQS